MPRRDTPKPPAFAPTPCFLVSDRFGDAPLQPHSRKNPSKVKNKPAYGGAIPPGVERGFSYEPQRVLPHIGTAATSVERFELSEPGGSYVAKHKNRRVRSPGASNVEPASSPSHMCMCHATNDNVPTLRTLV